MVNTVSKRFFLDERGISMTEALMIFPILLLILTSMVEAGIAVFQWNQSTKAVQIGARLAAVSSPIVGDAVYETLETTGVGSTPDGDPYPPGTETVSCGPDGSACETPRINRLLTGSDGACDPGATALGEIVGMCDVMGTIGVENVMVSYHRAGLGYVGRPAGPVTTVTIELREMNFDFLILDTLIPALGQITIPALPVSYTSEDVNDCKSTCP